MFYMLTFIKWTRQTWDGLQWLPGAMSAAGKWRPDQRQADGSLVSTCHSNKCHAVNDALEPGR